MEPLRVLIVEDNPINRLLAIKTVEKLGHQAVAASQGAEALQRLKEGPFDVVLMDCEMPQMDGFEAVRRIRAGGDGILDPAVPVIALTAHDQAEDRERCRAAGMTDHLTKPFRVEDLANALGRSRPPKPD